MLTDQLRFQTYTDEVCAVSDPEKSKSYRKLFDELIPEKCSHELLLAVLRNLIDEQISIRNLPMIIEAISESRLSDIQLATEFNSEVIPTNSNNTARIKQNNSIAAIIP